MIKKYFFMATLLTSILANSSKKDLLGESIASFKAETYSKVKKLDVPAHYFPWGGHLTSTKQSVKFDSYFYIVLEGDGASLTDNNQFFRMVTKNLKPGDRKYSINYVIGTGNWNQPEGPSWVANVYMPWVIEFGRFFLLVDLQKKKKEADLIVDETKKRAALENVESLFTEIKKDPRSLIKKTYGYNVK